MTIVSHFTSDLFMKVKKYLFTIPERMIKSFLVLSGGTAYEMMNFVIPKSVRSTKIYHATVNRIFQLVVEVLGGAKGTITNENFTGEEYVKRKATGNIVELLGLISWGISPVWFFAILADLTGGTKGFLEELVKEFKKQGIIDQNSHPKKIYDLLELIKEKSALLSENIDMPPLNQEQLNDFYENLKKKNKKMPENEELEVIYQDLQIISKDEKKSIFEISQLLFISLKNSGLKYSDDLLFSYYRETIKTIREQGMLKFMYIRFKPYLKGVGRNFHPDIEMVTDRVFDDHKENNKN